MAEGPAVPDDGRNADAASGRASGRTKDEVALELMKFIAVTTGYGKGATSAAGFSGKPSRPAEEYADALFQLFEQCRAILAKDPPK
jgi:hypothetical protein